MTTSEMARMLSRYFEVVQRIDASIAELQPRPLAGLVAVDRAQGP